MDSYSVTFHQYLNMDEVGSPSREQQMQRRGLEGMAAGGGTRKGFLEEEVCELGQEGSGEGRKE